MPSRLLLAALDSTEWPDQTRRPDLAIADPHPAKVVGGTLVKRAANRHRRAQHALALIYR